MTEEKIYLLKPVYKNYLWGGNSIRTVLKEDAPKPPVAESWEISVHPDGESLAGGLPLKSFFAGGLPIMVKYIDACANLSVQVHPDEAYARKNENDGGKSEIWHVVAAKDKAFIYLGFKRDVTRGEVERAIESGTVETLLNRISVRKGQSFFIPAGTVHAIGAGCLMLEIQQSSNVTYRMYDYGRGRPLQILKALDVLNFKALKDTSTTLEAAGKKLFESMNLSGGIREAEAGCEACEGKKRTRFVLIYGGSGTICADGSCKEASVGQTFMIVSKSLALSGGLKAAVITI